MKSSGKKIIYGVNLNNHFSPSFCSSTKTYFGTLDDIKTFVEGLNNEQFAETKEAFKRYLEGDTKVTHYIAYNQHRLIEKAEVLAEEEIELAKKIFERHTVLTKFLVSFGVDEQTASEDACRIEHIISDKSFSAMKKHLEENK